MAGVTKKRFIAVRGIDFDALDYRVEPGQRLPDDVSDGVIKMLLANGDIKEEGKEKEKEKE